MKGKNVAVLEGPRELSIISYSLVKTHDRERWALMAWVLRVIKRVCLQETKIQNMFWRDRRGVTN